MADPFTLEHFLPHVGEVYRVIIGDDRELLVQLSEIARLPGQPDRRASFSLVFHAPLGSELEQGIYRIEPPDREPFDCFLVPIGPDEYGARFEAIFT